MQLEAWAEEGHSWASEAAALSQEVAEVLQLQGNRECDVAGLELQRAVREMPQQAPEKREVVARFWMQNVSRLTGSVSCERAALGALRTLLEVSLEVFECGSFPRDDMLGVQDFLQGVLQPRLVLCLASLLSSNPDDASATQQKLDLLLQAPHNKADDASAAATAPEDLLQVQLHLLIVLDLMQQLPSLAFAPVELLQQASCKLLGWAVHTAACRLCCVVLADEAGGALVQHTLQCCLAYVVGCMAGLGLPVQQELLALLLRMTFDNGTQALVDIMSAVLQEGAEELLQLLQDVAAKHEPLHVLLAAVCGNIGVPAGNLKHEALFQQLLASPHWPVRHAAFDGLLARLRHNSYSGSNIVRLLPPSMRVSATEASPAVVQVVKAHLQRQPDAQALCKAEGEVRLLLSAASAAAQGHQLGGEEVVLLSRQGARLAGGCASLCSRLRALQDQLACLK
ncbi:hypothetical protein OEZ86_014144 [Tetradesmus obliquus]|nr:hypothetical protein OEZ86_014144 [Tetradesmus obliquus]